MNCRKLQRGAFSINVTAFVAFAMFACSSSSNNGTAGPTDPSTVGGFINSYCSYIGSCCGSQGRPSDGTQCRELLEFGNTSGYDPQKGQACIDAIKTASASDPAWCIASPSTTSAACDQATSSSPTGSGAPGAKCSTASDCAAGPTGSTVVCNFPLNSAGTSAQEICTVQVHGKAGDGPCFGTVTATPSSTVTTYNDSADAGAGTAPEVYCFIADGVSCDSTSSLCVALAQVGDSCAGTTQCVTTAHCDLTTQKCAANVATGGACVSSSDCISGDYCDGSSSTCAVQGGQGAACTSGDQCSSDDCESSKCGAGFGGSFGLALLCGGDGGS